MSCWAITCKLDFCSHATCKNHTVSFCLGIAVPMLLCCFCYIPFQPLHCILSTLSLLLIIYYKSGTVVRLLTTNCTAERECCLLQSHHLGELCAPWLEACSPAVLFFPQAHLVLFPVSCETSFNLMGFPISVQSQHLWLFFLMPIIMKRHKTITTGKHSFKILQRFFYKCSYVPMNYRLGLTH